MNNEEKDLGPTSKGEPGRARAWYIKHLRYRKHRAIELYPDGKLPFKVIVWNQMDMTWALWSAIKREKGDVLMEMIDERYEENVNQNK